jgi:hypothetical protein
MYVAEAYTACVLVLLIVLTLLFGFCVAAVAVQELLTAFGKKLLSISHAAHRASGRKAPPQIFEGRSAAAARL